MSYLTKQLKNYLNKLNYNYEDLNELENKLVNFTESNPNYIELKKVNIKYKVYNSWINLMKEWTIRTKAIKDKPTYVYFAKCKNNKRECKIGITNDPKSRYSKKDDYYCLQIIRKFDNRYQAAYVEYKLRTLFCNGVNNELISSKYLNDIIKYVKRLKYSKKVENELKVLGFTHIK